MAGREHIVASRTETFDDSELRQSAFRAAARQYRDQVDRFSNEGARNGDDGFLDELFESPQGADRRAGVDRADPARMAGAPGFQQVQRFGAAHLADRYTVGPQPQR